MVHEGGTSICPIHAAILAERRYRKTLTSFSHVTGVCVGLVKGVSPTVDRHGLMLYVDKQNADFSAVPKTVEQAYEDHTYRVSVVLVFGNKVIDSAPIPKSDR